jgi:hypothetical protein
LTQEEVAEELIRLSSKAGGTEIKVNAAMISNWECGRKRPRKHYRRLFCLLYAATEEDLGFRPSAAKLIDASVGELFSPGQLSLLTGLLDGFDALGVRAHPRSGVADFMDPVAVEDLELLASAYRRSYRQMSAHYLLPQSVKHLQAAVQFLKQGAPPQRLVERLVAIIAQMSMLIGTLLFHDRGDAVGGNEYYRLAQDAAKQLEDQELAVYLLGGLSFVSCYRGNRREAVGLIEHSREFAAKHASPWTQAWLAAVAGEMYATSGLEQQSLRALDAAEAILLKETCPPDWIGIGSFDLAKLRGYRGTCNLRLRRPQDAYPVLSVALRDLDPGCLKHRCTAQADLAAVMIAMDEIEEGARLAIDVLDTAAQIEHFMSVRRIGAIAKVLIRQKNPPRIVGELQGRLRNLAPLALDDW